MVTAIQLEWGVAGARILGIVISKLGHGQESGPIVLFEVNKGSEVRFHRTILSFRLAVRLGVKGSREPPLDAKEVAERRPEFQGEERPSIGND